MPSVKVSVPHGLSAQEALDRLQSYILKAKEMYGDKVSNLREDWQENVLEFGFSAMGMSTSGKVVFEEQFVHVESKVPLMALPFRGQIEEQIRSQISRALT